jgi:hypothetical protein
VTEVLTGLDAGDPERIAALRLLGGFEVIVDLEGTG